MKLSISMNQLNASPTQRVQHLDALRASAILLVLGAHKYAFALWKNSGWIGVDLFFVLSGFLVSGLIFSEFKRFKAIRVGRFLIRRTFKIYPAFLFMLCTTLGIEVFRGSPISVSKCFADLLFVQNYLPSIYGHTWSIVVEVHFYLILVFYLLWVSRRGTSKLNPFGSLLPAVLVVSIVCLSLRVATVYGLSGKAFDVRDYLCPTHLRLDSLAAGSIISYWYHYHHERLMGFSRRWRWAILGVSSALLAIVIFVGIEHAFVLTAGFTFLYLGFGGLLVVCLGPPPRRIAAFRPYNLVGCAVECIGLYSYGIYLWHMIVVSLGLSILHRITQGHSHYLVDFAAYAVASILLGIVMTELTEAPALRIRDWLFPSRGRIDVFEPAPSMDAPADRPAPGAPVDPLDVTVTLG